MCTYKRASLEKTLESLIIQKLPEGYTLEIIVVDNDIAESGRTCCNKFAKNGASIDVRYYVNGVRNISEVRNSSMAFARGDLLAFIDDDEWASDDSWLYKLIETLNTYEADVVFGRVLVHYPKETPSWIVSANMLGKRTHAHGKSVAHGATSNAIMNAQWVREKHFKFDPFFGKSGGEDSDFFHRIYLAGGKLVYDTHALVEESAEPHRLNMPYFKKVNIRIGQTYYYLLWSRQRGCAFIATGFLVIAQIAAYGLLTLVNLPFGKSRYSLWYVRLISNIVKLKTAVTRGGKTIELYGNN